MSTPKKIKIICEVTYEDSISCKLLVGSLKKALKKKRQDYEVLQTYINSGPEDLVYLVGMGQAWMEQTVRSCNLQGTVPIILTDRNVRAFAGTCHLICPDTHSMLYELKKRLADAGRNVIALYGINRGEDSDKSRAEALSGLVSDVESIYESTGNLESCFRSFLPRAEYYDTVICMNGYAALSLAKKLEKECPGVLETLVILSFEEVLRHSKYNRWIKLIDLQLEAYGAAAAAAAELAQSKESVSAMIIKMKYKVCEIPSKEYTESIPAESQRMIDPEILHMAKIEQLLRDADDMDHHIIAMLLDNAKYSEIADTCYMTEGNVKYRVKKYMSICGCRTKKELLVLLQEYLQ